jgi:hypothetical protein
MIRKKSTEKMNDKDNRNARTMLAELLSKDLAKPFDELNAAAKSKEEKQKIKDICSRRCW